MIIAKQTTAEIVTKVVSMVKFILNAIYNAANAMVKKEASYNLTPFRLISPETPASQVMHVPVPRIPLFCTPGHFLLFSTFIFIQDDGSKKIIL